MHAQATPGHDAWSAWHPGELGRHLRGVSEPWCIVGGWALDLWHGYRTRDHEDLEFSVLRDDFETFRQALNGLDFYTAQAGVVAYLPDGDVPAPDIAQVWCLDAVERRWRVDVMIEPGTPEIWVYKRDPRIARPRTAMVARTPDGLPYLKPAAVLLFKAKHRRPKDEIDFRNALPKLDEAERAWLKACLDAAHPGHAWARSL